MLFILINYTKDVFKPNALKIKKVKLKVIFPFVDVRKDILVETQCHNKF